MAITLFQPEIWKAELLAALEKALVYAGAPCVNRDYEGEISAAGDTVHISSVADPTILDYAKDTDLTVQVLTDAEQLLLVDQAKAFAFEIDDIDMRQSKSGGALMSEAALRAAWGLRDVADRFVRDRMLLAATNKLGIVDATTVANVYDAFLVPAGVKLDEANVPTEGRFAVISPSAYGKMLLDPRFVNANQSGTAALHNGVVGEAAGFTIVKSNNAFQSNRTGVTATTVNGQKTLTADVANTFNQGDIGLSVTGTGVGNLAKVVSVDATGTVATVDVNSSASAKVADIALAGGGPVAVAGSAIATTYAEQISKVEGFRPEKRFADALKGLHLYGSKVVRPTGLVVASVKVA